MYIAEERREVRAEIISYVTESISYFLRWTNLAIRPCIFFVPNFTSKKGQLANRYILRNLSVGWTGLWLGGWTGLWLVDGSGLWLSRDDRRRGGVINVTTIPQFEEKDCGKRSAAGSYKQ